MDQTIEKKIRSIENKLSETGDEETGRLWAKMSEKAAALEDACRKEGKSLPNTVLYDHCVLLHSEWLDEKPGDDRLTRISEQYAFQKQESQKAYEVFRSDFDVFIRAIYQRGREEYLDFVAFINNNGNTDVPEKKVKNRRRKNGSTVKKKKNSVSSKNAADKQSVSEHLKASKRKEYMISVKEGIARCNMLEGQENANLFRTYKDLESKDAFLDLKLKSGMETVTSGRLIETDWMKEWKCEIITGGIGYGKSLLVHRIADRLIDRYQDKIKDKMIIFVSPWNRRCLRGKEGEEYFRLFLRKELPKRWKMVVIVDGLDELMNKGIFTRIEKLFDACEYYRASMIINCRSALFNQIKDMGRPVITACWELQGVEEENIVSVADSLLEKGKLSRKTVFGLLGIPYYWMLMKCQPMSVDSLFLNNDYRFIGSMYRCMEKREEHKYNLPANYFDRVREVLKGIALAQSEYGGDGVTIQACMEWSRLSMDEYKEIINASFFKEFVRIEIENYETEIPRGIIRGFKEKIYSDYFTVYGLCDVLREGTDQIKRLLDNVSFIDEIKALLGCCVQLMAADEKKSIRLKLQNLLSEETENSKVYTSCREMLAIFA